MGISFSRDEKIYEKEFNGRAMVGKIYYTNWPDDKTRERSRGKVLSILMEPDDNRAQTYYFTEDLD